MKKSKKKEPVTFRAQIDFGEKGCLFLPSTALDKLNQEIFQQLYDDGFFKEFKDIDWDVKFPCAGFEALRQMCGGGVLITSSDRKYYHIDRYYISYKLKYINKQIESRENYDPNKAYVVDDVSKENFIFDKIGMEDYMKTHGGIVDIIQR